MNEHFRLEIALLRRTRLFTMMAGALIVLAALSGGQGGQLVRAQAGAIEAARDLETRHDAKARAKAEEIRLGEIDPPWWQSPLNAQSWSYSMIRHVSLPPKDLGGVAIGDADIQPFLFRINPHPPDRWSNRASELTPSVAAYGGFDLTDVLLVLTPLLVIVAFVDVIRDRSGSERQRLAVVQAASEPLLLLQRLLPRAVIVLLVVLAASLVGIVATRPPVTPEVLSGAAVVLLVFAVNALFWIVLVGGFVLTIRAAVLSFAGVVSLWFVFGVLAPVIVDGAARLSSLPPSPLKVFAHERAEIVRSRMMEEELTRTYAAKDPLARDMLLEALSQNRLLITPTNLIVQMEIDRRRAEAREAEREAGIRFTDSARRFSWLSPTLTARKVIYALAGRDHIRRRAFDAQVAAYHAELQEAFVPLLMRRATLDNVLLPKPFVFEEPRSN